MVFRLRPGTKKVGYYLTALFVIYVLCIRKRTITEKFEFTLNDVDPKTVWEFWADFSNFAKINPTIIDFEIDYEKGTYDNWEYGVTYYEHLTLLPFTVYMKGRYKVIPEEKRGHFTEPYRITSENDACVGIFCTHAESYFSFTTVGNSKTTKVIETTTMDCPPILVWYQRAEARTQKKHVGDQLKLIDFSV